MQSNVCRIGSSRLSSTPNQTIEQTMEKMQAPSDIEARIEDDVPTGAECIQLDESFRGTIQQKRGMTNIEQRRIEPVPEDERTDN